jgi:glycerol kinase
MSRCILAIDQGTTSTRLILFDEQAKELGSASRELTQHFPQTGWVEHDGEEIWQAVIELVLPLLEQTAVDPRRIAAIGVTNQRETAVLWDRATGRPVTRAIVWQDRRTADFCKERRSAEEWLYRRSGLVLDPYFSASKIRWMLENLPGVRHQAATGQLAFGTIDSFLIWRLTGGQVHATDFSNAARTQLLNLDSVRWDPELCRFFSVPLELLPEVKPSTADFGTTRQLGVLPDGIPIRGVAGDQQAALFGQHCFAAGQAKCTYGTGAFLLVHTGEQPVLSRHRLLATLAASPSDRPQYALEGSVFIAGAAIQWLRDGLGILESSRQVEQLARQGVAASEVVFVPALVGLGAPYWVPEARGAIYGITRATTAADLARAALEGVAWQIVELVEAAAQDCRRPIQYLRVDGGMTRNDYFMQLQADCLGQPLWRAAQTEATALGAALLAGLGVGIWPSLEALGQLYQEGRRFDPQLAEGSRVRRRRRWTQAVQSTIAHHAQETLPAS